MLYAMADTVQVDGRQLDISTVTTMRRYGLEDMGPVQYEHDYVDCPPISELSEFKQSIIPYIGGYAAKMTAEALKCDTCVASLGSKTHISPPLFLRLKDNGGLFKPTDSVVVVCEWTERKIQHLMKRTEGVPPKGIDIIILNFNKLDRTFIKFENILSILKYYMSFVFSMPSRSPNWRGSGSVCAAKH